MGDNHDRRTALATAGAIAVGALTAALAVGANFGLFGLASADRREFVPASSEEEATTTTTVPEPVIETRIVDVPVPEPVMAVADNRGPSGTSGPSESSGPGSTSSGPSHDHDDDLDEPDDDEDDVEDDVEDDDDHGRNRGPGGGDDDDQDDEDDD